MYIEERIAEIECRLDRLEALQRRVDALESFHDFKAAAQASDQVLAIIHQVAARHKVLPSEIKSNRRLAHLVLARHVAIYLAHSVTNLSCELLAQLFNKERSSISFAITSIRHRLEAYPDGPEAKEINGWLIALESAHPRSSV